MKRIRGYNYWSSGIFRRGRTTYYVSDELEINELWNLSIFHCNCAYEAGPNRKRKYNDDINDGDCCKVTIREKSECSGGVFATSVPNRGAVGPKQPLPP